MKLKSLVSFSQEDKAAAELGGGEPAQEPNPTPKQSAKKEEEPEDDYEGGLCWVKSFDYNAFRYRVCSLLN